MKYTEAYELISHAIKIRERLGYEYPAGSARKGALFLANSKPDVDKLTAFMSRLERRPNNWDGSIA